MADLIARLAEIREQQGLDPLPDPTKIQGYGEAPPPYEVRERDPGAVPEPDWLNPDADIDVLPDDLPTLLPHGAVDRGDSPLIPRQNAQGAPGGQFVPMPDLPVPDMAVGVYGESRAASWKGSEVVLTEKEAASIARVVISALRRDLRERDKQLAGAVPTKKRKRTGAPTRKAGEGDSPASIPPVRKLGRPKGSKNRQRLDGSVT